MFGVLATTIIRIDDSLWSGYFPNPAAPTQNWLWAAVTLVLLIAAPIHIRNVRKKRALWAADPTLEA